MAGKRVFVQVQADELCLLAGGCSRGTAVRKLELSTVGEGLQGHLDRLSPPFELLQVVDLLPERLREQYAAAGGEE